MGAFVGAVTSPFLRRRKGRIGQERIVEHTPAPALAGATIRFAASNDLVIMCGPNATTTVQISKNAGASWGGLVIAAPNVIGNNAAAGHCLVTKPWNIYVALGANPHQNNGFDSAGVRPATGGSSVRINRDGNFSNELYTVAGAPLETLAYTEDGTYFCAMGAKVAGVAECAGGRVGVAVEFFDFACTAANGMSTIIPLVDPNTPFGAAFIGCEASAALDAFQAHKVWRISAASWGHKAINVPAIVGVHGHEGFQRNEVIIFSDASNPNIIRSRDYGETWEKIAIGAGAVGPTKDIYRYGRFLYCLMRDAPRIMRSRTMGATWEQNPIQFPSGTAVPDVHINHAGEHWIFCHDGAANRIYHIKHPMDI